MVHQSISLPKLFHWYYDFLVSGEYAQSLIRWQQTATQSYAQQSVNIRPATFSNGQISGHTQDI